jgi:hypothetical protein
MGDRSASATVAGGVFLINLGMLLLTGWWWPGIMVAIGLAGAAGLLYRGWFAAALATLLLFLGVPVAIALNQHIEIPWNLLAPFVLIALGLTWLVRGFVTREPIEP